MMFVRYSECASTPGKLKSIPKVAGSIPTVANLTFQLARCGCTLRVTAQTSYSPEYITPTHTTKLELFISGNNEQTLVWIKSGKINKPPSPASSALSQYNLLWEKFTIQRS
jgi:hypothetical protein